MSDTAQGPRPRPLSPHLQIYRLPMTAITSIMHRITGFALSAGLVIGLWWLYALIGGYKSYEFLYLVVTHPLGKIALIAASWAVFYHMLAGIRHVWWDITACGINKEAGARSSWIVIIGSIALTAAYWVMSCACGGY